MIDRDELDRCERLLTACTCIPDYKNRGRSDPSCEACSLGVEIIDTFRELRRVWLAVDSAPEAWAGFGPNGYGAGSDFTDAEQVKQAMSGWGTPEECARITVTRVRLVPLATGGKNG